QAACAIGARGVGRTRTPGVPARAPRSTAMNAEVHPRAWGLPCQTPAGYTARTEPCLGRSRMSARPVGAAVKWMPLWLSVVWPLAVHADNVTDLMDRGRWKEARAAVATMEPGRARTHYLQSRVQLAFDQPDEALASAERALQLESSNALYHTQVAAVCGQMAG